ncbi:MAG: hypothetical protein R3F24_04035 [Gammaproteobacteria bacterium]
MRRVIGMIPCLLVACLLVTASDVTAQTTEKRLPTESSDQVTDPWNTSTRSPASSQEDTSPPTESTLNLTVYPRLGNGAALLPYRSSRRLRDGPAYATGVTAVVTRCADGSQRITALIIGGHMTPLDSQCDNTQQPSSDVSRTNCDANRWTCR